MNCLSLNTRGLGVDVKTQWVRRLKVTHKINFMGLQETQMMNHSSINIDGCWDSTDHDSEGVDPNGRWTSDVNEIKK